jgi:hypothetical protein
MTTPITTPLQFRDRVRTLLGNRLGTYTHLNGYTEPAIAVGGRPAEGIKVMGIEIRIPPAPFVARSYWAGGFLHQDRYYDIILVQHSGNQLYECVDRLMRHFPNSKGIEIPDYDAVKNLPQYRVTIYVPDLFEGIVL